MQPYKKFASKIASRLNVLSKSSRTLYGVPFVLLIVLSSFGLKEFTAIRYQYRDVGLLIHEEAKKAGVEIKKPGEVTLDSVYETIKDLDIEHWENKRGPRPWEESSS